MKIMRHIASYLLLLPLLLTACVRETWPEAGGTDGWVIPFGAAPSADVIVSTKGTMTDPASENVVYNLYVMVFDEYGYKVSGAYLDHDRLGSGEDNYWEYTNDAKSAGTIHLKSSKSSEEASDNCTIVAIANLNAEMVNITEKQLDDIGSLTELRNVSAELIQPITSRSGYFPMCGVLTGVNLFGENPVTHKKDKIEFTNGSTLNLERLDAKVYFNVRVEKDHDIYEFSPVSWQVVNVPRYCAILPDGTLNIPEGETMDDMYFNGNESIFETETLTTDTYSYNNKKICIHGFSFYMMENQKAPKETPSSYADRDKKSGDGSFEFADDLATYVILKGRLSFKSSADSPITHAEVKYLIHLGDFGNSDTSSDKIANFDIERNHSYTYNIYIQGVNDIKTYVTTTGDPAEPGASGDIVVPLRKLYTCDSHYSTIAIDFYYSDLKDREDFSWWVQTPFSGGVERIFNTSDRKLYARNEEGELSEVDIASDAVDYNWVEFRVNEKNSGKYDANTWVTYKPLTGTYADGKTYTLPGLMNYLASEVEKYESEVAAVKASSAFDNQGTPAKAKITVTGFVNENYYEKDPTDPGAGYNPTLWRRFVNQPVRTMCILSGGQVRGESSYVQASFIIQQYSIQSVYNVDSEDIKIGWGAEYMTDARELQCNRNTSRQGAYSPTNTTEKRGNTDPDNGRWDTMIEWGLRTSAADSPFDDSKQWKTYVNLTDGKESDPYMNNKNNPEDKTLDYKYLRYACMSRNRDNNGNGTIDKEEVRWYMAASNQLINLYLGSYGIEAPAGLYQRTAEERAVNTQSSWRHHVLGSDAATIGGAQSNSDQDSRTVWAEEGPTGSYMSRVPDQSSARLTVRCIRNFGEDIENGNPQYGYDVTYSPETVTPDALIIVKQIYKDPTTGEERVYTENKWDPNNDWESYKDVYLDFDCSRLNKKSLRYYTDRELAPHNEFNEAACLYERFQTTTVSESLRTPNNKGYSVDEINDDIDMKGYNTWCPDGYRLPNVRELGVICYFFENSEVFVTSKPDKVGTEQGYRALGRTRFSFGATGLGYDGAKNKWGWAVGYDKYYRAIVANDKVGKGHDSKSIRCVKDVKVVE